MDSGMDSGEGKCLRFQCQSGPARLRCRASGVAAVACFEAARELQLPQTASLSAAPGDVSAKRSPQWSSIWCSSSQASAGAASQGQASQQQAKKYTPSTCQVPGTVPARFYSTRQAAGVAACCGMGRGDNWKLEPRACRCSCMHALRIATRRAGSRQQIVWLLQQRCDLIPCWARYKGGTCGGQIWVPCQGKMDRSSDRDRTKQQVARKGRDRHRGPGRQNKVQFAQCRWECVSQTEERRMQRKGAGIGIE